MDDKSSAAEERMHIQSEEPVSKGKEGSHTYTSGRCILHSNIAYMSLEVVESCGACKRGVMAGYKLT